MPEQHYPSFERDVPDYRLIQRFGSFQCQNGIIPRSNAYSGYSTEAMLTPVSMPERHYPSFEPATLRSACGED